MDKEWQREDAENKRELEIEAKREAETEARIAENKKHESAWEKEEEQKRLDYINSQRGDDQAKSDMFKFKIKKDREFYQKLN